jgi:hypothetical protein
MRASLRVPAPVITGRSPRLAMHWHARIPRHRHLPHYLRTTMLIDAERDDEAVMRAEDQAIAAQEAGVDRNDDTFTLPDSLAHLLRTDDGYEAPVHDEATR